MNMKTRPLVLVPACGNLVHGMPARTVGSKYLEAVTLAGALPLVLADARPEELPALLDMADGVFLTGSPSNVHPSVYGQAVHDTSLPLDPQRDAWVLPLVRLALEHGVPLLGICRGLQEINVALGGTLHQAVHEQPGLRDHRPPEGADPETAYAPVHEVHVAPGGLLHSLLDASTLQVNSLHGQGIARLADGLRAEAHAPDRLVEAFSLPTAPAFNLAVQWHPEWRAATNPASLQMLQAFGAACRARRDRRIKAAAQGTSHE